MYPQVYALNLHSATCRFSLETARKKITVEKHLVYSKHLNRQLKQMSITRLTRVLTMLLRFIMFTD